MSLLLSRFVERAGDPRVAIVDERGAHTYAALVTSAGSLARAVSDGSLGGQRIAILAPPGARFVAAFFGVLLAGGTALVLSPLHPRAETVYLCEDAGVAHVILADEMAGFASFFEGMSVRDLDALLEGGAPGLDPGPDPARLIGETTAALQLYTSGTTGRPKGAVLTHGNLAVQQALLGDAWGFTPDDVLLHALPLHHMHGLAIALLTALGKGARVEMTTFEARAVWERMAGATVFMGVPSMYHRLFAAFDAEGEPARARWTANAKALRLATSGSAALPVTLAERWRALTGEIPLERFGMTEIGVGLSNPLHGERVPGCVGFPLATVETRIVDDDGHDAETGELWIRGPSVFAGYHARPDEDEKAFVGDAMGSGAWFRTGDTVTRDAAREGSPFKILGRTSVDILKSGGYKLSALEIEEVLRMHPAVCEVAVIGLPDEAWGERVVACVVLHPGSEEGSPRCDAAALRDHVRASLAPYKVPKDIVFLNELPKNALGKVVKPELSRRLSP
jgi:malonyl-CoA/methylmalonyl-CoA synthetase